MTKQQLLETIRRVIKQELNEALTPEEQKELEELEYEFTSDAQHDSAISPSLYKRYKELKAKAKTDEAKYPVAGENGYIRVSQLKKGDILGGSGLEIVSMSSGAMTPSGKIEVTVRDPKTGKELTKLWGKSTTVKLKDKTDEAAAPAPSKPKEKPGPAVAPGKPGEKQKPRRPLGNPSVKPAPKATMSEAEMLNKIIKRFRSAKKNG